MSKDNDKKSQVVNSQPGKRSGNAVPDAPQGGYIQRINNDAREDEMEENMQAVGSVLGNLKSMARDMGGEIERQNKQLDKVNDKVFILFIFCFEPISIHFYPPAPHWSRMKSSRSKITKLQKYVKEAIRISLECIP